MLSGPLAGNQAFRLRSLLYSCESDEENFEEELLIDVGLATEPDSRTCVPTLVTKRFAASMSRPEKNRSLPV